MKRQIITLMLAIVAVLTASAQKKMVIVVDGVEKPIGEVWRIDEIKFVPTDVVTLTDDPDSLEFGLKARWADRNMGAASPKDPGFLPNQDNKRALIGWGDTTLTNYSKKLEYFPIENVDKDIAGGNYDVAKQKWASKWHMPTEAEIQELIEACDWTWVNDVDNDSVGVVGTLKTDETKTIFFPVTGYREGETDPAEAAKGYYWTGSLAQTSTECARFFSFSEDAPTPVVVSDKKRYIGMAIRPVLGQLEIPTTIESVTISGVTDKAASVVVTLAGSLKDVTLAGLAYGKSNNLSTSDTDDNSHQVLEIGNPLTFPFDNLEHNTTYYVMAYVKKNDGSYLTYTIMSFTTEQAQNFPVAEAVDMGLPSGTKWASWNMGASSPKEVPTTNYARFVWGDPTGEVHNTTDLTQIAAYHDTAISGNNVVDIAGTKYDIAHIQWGGNWRLPTIDDFTELDYYTTWEWYDEGTNKRGWKVTSRLNNNVIYVPAAGYKNVEHTIVLTGDNNNGIATPIYWTSKGVNSELAYTVRPSEGTPYEEKRMMYAEASIRPVYKTSSSQEEPVVDPTPTPTEPTDPVTIEAGSAVDLGLSSGTKWADRNVGAANANATGEYFCWGDTQQREQYKIADYIYYDPVNGYNEFTYLSTQTNYVVEYSIGGTEYDAAHVRWGGTWRMPTRAQMNELINECTWTWTNRNGTTGYLIKGKNNNSIFLPAAGRMTQTDDQPMVFEKYDIGIYWTCQAYDAGVEEIYNTAGRTLEFTESSKSVKEYRRRYIGLPIRPVMP